MPVEIRELIIRTEIKSRRGTTEMTLDSEVLQSLKKQLLEECRRTIKKQSNRNGFNR